MKSNQSTDEITKPLKTAYIQHRKRPGIFCKNRHNSIKIIRFGLSSLLAGLLLTSSFADFDSLRLSLQPLTLNFHVDSTSITHNEIIADSATIISPQIRSSLDGSDCVIEIKPEPELSIDSILLFVKHSANTVDTIGVISHSPYLLNWHYADIPDQDQMHLQFGYILYLQSGDKIISPPLPHRWVINRNISIHRKTFRSRQTTKPEQFEIDGDLHDWNRVRKTALGSSGNVRMVWTSGMLYFAVEIKDNSITSGDAIELHFDMYNTKNNFAGINHRSMRFGPRTRGLFFTVELNDSGFTTADSVTMLQNEHTVWKSKITSDGYSIEAAISLFSLSDQAYPSMKSGFDITHIDIDENSPDTVFYSWAGNNSLYARYNPSQWGTLTLHQAMLPLSLTMLLSAVIFSLLILSITIWFLYHHIHETRIEHEEETGYSESLELVLLCIKNNIDNSDLTAVNVAAKTGIDHQIMHDLINHEAHCTFEHLLMKERIAQAKLLLAQKEYTLSQIVSSAGFHTLSEFQKSFKVITGTTPEIFHKRKMSEKEEDEL